MEFRVGAVLPAGGCGVRMGLETPKQYCSLLRRPLLSYTVHAFESVGWIDPVVVLVSPEYLENVQAMMDEYGHSKVILATADTTRHRTIQNGVRQLVQMASPPDVVLIHDAVRPFVDALTMRQVAQAAWEHGASGAICPLVSTVIAVNSSGFLDHSLERSKYRASEMPQGFRLSVIHNAYEKCTDYDFEFGTECLHLADKYSDVKARLVEGNTHLWKITHKRDLYGAEGVVKETFTRVRLVGFEGNVSLRQKLTKQLAGRGIKICSDAEGTTVTSADDSIVEYSSSWDEDKLNLQLENLPQRDAPGFTQIYVNVIKTSDIEKDFFKMKKCLSRLQKEEKSLSVVRNIVAVDDDSDVDQVSEVIASLVFDRNTAYSGQVFLS